jgi:hypothetical protein
MLQRGLLDVPDLDASWCSSISWFFLCSFGLNPVYRLLLGEENGEFSIQIFLSKTPSPSSVFHRRTTCSPEAVSDGQTAAVTDMELVHLAIAASDLQQMQAPTAMPAMPGAPAVDFKKLFRDERENLDIVDYKWVCEGVEDRVLEMFK